MYTQELENSGFDFSLFDRNTSLESKVTPFANKYTKTGTTICAVMHKTGVVFAADTRATAGSVVMDLDCIKVHSLSDNIIAAGAGTAADLFATINMISAELQMQKMNTGSENRLSHVEHRLHDYLFKHMGHIGVALIVGGFDINGADIMVMSPNGNSMHVPYAAMGSGSLAALSVLETNYRDGLDEQQAIDLAADAIQAGIFHDLGSGSNVNVFSVTKSETKKLYKYREFNKKVYKDEDLFKFKGVTPVLSRYEVNWSDIKIEKIPIKIDDNKMMIELA